MEVLSCPDFESGDDLLVPSCGRGGLEDVVKVLFFLGELADFDLVAVGRVEDDVREIVSERREKFLEQCGGVGRRGF